MKIEPYEVYIGRGSKGDVLKELAENVEKDLFAEIANYIEHAQFVSDCISR